VLPERIEGMGSPTTARRRPSPSGASSSASLPASVRSIATLRVAIRTGRPLAGSRQRPATSSSIRLPLAIVSLQPAAMAVHCAAGSGLSRPAGRRLAR
jgi:hypothetical protein